MLATLVGLSGLVTLIGFLNLTGATKGVGIICIGCFIGILARIYQASIRDEIDFKEEEKS